MRKMPTYNHRGYTVVVNALPTGEGRFFSVFSIHQGEKSGALGVPVVYQEGRGAGVVGATVEEAHSLAADRADAWIDSQPRD